jgi:putative Mn2+ efflux pump MntP
MKTFLGYLAIGIVVTAFIVACCEIGRFLGVYMEANQWPHWARQFAGLLVLVVGFAMYLAMRRD